MLSQCLCVVCGFDVPTSDNRRKLFSSYKKTTACNNLEIILGYDIGPELSHTPNNCIICKRCYKKNITLAKKIDEVRSKYITTKENLLVEAQHQGEISVSDKRMCKDSGPDNTKIRQSRSASVSHSRVGSSRELFPLNGASFSSEESSYHSDQSEETAVRVSGLFGTPKNELPMRLRDQSLVIGKGEGGCPPNDTSWGRGNYKRSHRFCHNRRHMNVNSWHSIL